MIDDASSSGVLWVVVVALVVGLLLGYVGGLLTADANSADTDDATVGASWSSGGTSCYEGPEDNVGWVHVVATGERWTTTLNATVVHPQGTDVTVNVSQRPTGEYEIALETVPGGSEKPLRNEPCQAATDITVATALPKPTFVVTMNGRPVRTVDQEGTVGTLYQLPNPINATENQTASIRRTK